MRRRAQRERARCSPIATLVVLVAIAWAVPVSSSRVVIDRAELFVSSLEQPDLDSCTTARLPAGNSTRGLVAAPDAFVWLFADVSSLEPSTPITMQVVDDDGGVVYAWKRHVFAPGVRCLVGSFAAIPLLAKFGPERQLLAQLIVDDRDVRIAMPFRMVPGPPRSVLTIATDADAIDCDFGADEPSATTLLDTSLVVLCVELAPTDAGKPIAFEFASPSAGVVSTYQGDSSRGRPVLFMPVGARQLHNANSPNGTFSVAFDVGGERRLTRPFSLVPAGKPPSANTTNAVQLRFCPHKGSCSTRPSTSVAAS